MKTLIRHNPAGLRVLKATPARICAPKARSLRSTRSAIVTRIQAASPDVASAPEAPPAPRPNWDVASGQDGSHVHDAPMVGRPLPLGATYMHDQDAVNFAIYSGSAITMSLVLFTEGDLNAGRATVEIPLDPDMNKSGDPEKPVMPEPEIVLAAAVADAAARPAALTPMAEDSRDPLAVPPVDGVASLEDGIIPEDVTPVEEEVVEEEEVELDMVSLVAGHRFNNTKVMVDPYAKVMISRREYGQLGPDIDYNNDYTLGLAQTWPQAAGAVPGPEAEFDWQGDKPLGLPMEQLVIYEMHVRGYTKDESSGAHAAGTYLGMVEKLDYLQTLGVNAVELLPMQEFNELEYYSMIPGTDEYRFNFWGYSTAGFFAPMSRFSYAAAKGHSPVEIKNEFKMLVREAHKRGIEVILDVVFNHTDEGNENGPTISFRGLDNRVYYVLAPGGEYYNYSGCGNTINCNHPVVRTFILDCLRHWVTEYHVDGFRFDLASILTRAHSAWHPQKLEEDGYPLPGTPAGIIPDAGGVPTGTPLSDPALIEMISDDPILRGTKMISEAWDCDGLYQVGAFPHYGGRWAEWNGKFRDTVRSFIKGSDGAAGNFAAALCGSPDIYANDTPPEDNWWANNAGRKWWGNRSPLASINFITAHDGFTLADLRLRQRQMRNLFAALLLSSGVPMFFMGDEYGHTKSGNNNTYCHDSKVNWIDWDAAKADTDGFARFSRCMVQLRRTNPLLQRTSFVTDTDIQWHGVTPNEPDWSHSSRLVAFSLKEHNSGGGLFVAFNTAHTGRLLTLPHIPGRLWQPLVDSGKQAPYDFLVVDDELSEEDVESARMSQAMWTGSSQMPMMPWSVIVMESVPEGKINSSLRAAPASEPAWSKQGRS
eukprot:gene30104-35072_t